MARKVRGFERVLDAPALFAIAYGEIGSSIYIALGIVAAAGARSHTGGAALHRPRLPRSWRSRTRRARRRSPRPGGAETFARRGVQRPRRLRHRLGAVPRLPDRDRAVRAVPAALRRRRAVGPGAAREPLGRRRRCGRDRGRSRGCGCCAGRGCIGRARRRAARPRRAGAHRRARARAPVLAGDAGRRALAGARAGLARRPAVRAFRSACSPTPGSRRSPTSRRRRASRAARCRARCSRRSGSSCCSPCSWRRSA